MINAMRSLLENVIIKPLRRFSPEAADHFRYLLIEIWVAYIHLGASRACFRRYANGRGLKVNFGSGSAPKTNFLNLDFAPQADVRLDLRRAIPLPDSCCSFVYSEHFVEHLSYPEGVERFFADCFRILEEEGKISISVPDTKWPLEEYGHGRKEYLANCIERRWHPEGCDTFIEHINFHFRQRWRNDSYSHFENHKFAWDLETMQKKLREAGFNTVVERRFDPLLDSRLREVGSLFVEATKPVTIARVSHESPSLLPSEWAVEAS